MKHIHPAPAFIFNQSVSNGEPLLKTFQKIIDKISDIFAFIAGVLLLYLVVSITIDVICRYVFSRPLPNTTDISEILLHFITFLTAAWVMKLDGHVKMDFILALASEKVQHFINAITSIVSALICLVLCYFGSVVTWDLYTRHIVQGVMLELPQAPLMIIIPISFFLLFFQCVNKSVEYFQKWNTARHAA